MESLELKERKLIRTSIMDKRQLKLSLTISWLVLSLVAFVILILPHVLSNESVFRLMPICESKAKYSTECVLCGMTTSFIDISHGDFRQAYLANRGSIPLYFLLLSNEIFVLVYVVILFTQHRRFLHHPARSTVTTTQHSHSQ